MDEPNPSAHHATDASSNVFIYSDTEVSHILGILDGDASFLHIPSKVDLQRNYEQESKRLVTMQLHLTTLGEYYKSHRIPRGMRNNLKPTMYTQDIDFKSKYERITNRYALDLILLNIEFLQKDVSQSRLRTTALEDSLKSALNQNDYEVFLEKQSTFLAKFRSELEEQKRHKWYRDSQDYSSGRIYNWNNNYNTQRQNKRPKDVKNNFETVTSTNFTNVATDDAEVFLDPAAGSNPPGGEAANTTGNTRTRSQRQPKSQTPKYNQKKKVK
ncbi:uncharacterized protein LOC130295627 [Hyla sarda]|uniref:uncharacterized protein LOC130295627 n=1 Tax=Hyla sarda TaxID=327740 RepID=UPI0024C2CA72|nr:uncharacterized protein LOC130295627 [Hyla sarda]